MWAPRYFAPRYWAPRYWSDGSAGVAVDFPLKINDVEIPIRHDGHGRTWDPLAPSVRSAHGVLRSATTSSRPRKQTLRLETPALDSSEWPDVLSELNRAGPQAATGYLVGGSMTVLIRNVRWRTVQSLYRRISFEMLEAT